MSAHPISVSINPELAAKAQIFAEHRRCSLDDLAAEALRAYIGLEPGASPQVRAHLQRAMQLGLTADEYAVLLVKESREERRAERKHTSGS